MEFSCRLQLLQAHCNTTSMPTYMYFPSIAMVDTPATSALPLYIARQNRGRSPIALQHSQTRCNFRNSLVRAACVAICLFQRMLNETVCCHKLSFPERPSCAPVRSKATIKAACLYTLPFTRSNGCVSDKLTDRLIHRQTHK